VPSPSPAGDQLTPRSVNTPAPTEPRRPAPDTHARVSGGNSSFNDLDQRCPGLFGAQARPDQQPRWNSRDEPARAPSTRVRPVRHPPIIDERDSRLAGTSSTVQHQFMEIVDNFSTQI
jgi:hypothetical protein